MHWEVSWRDYLGKRNFHDLTAALFWRRGLHKQLQGEGITSGYSIGHITRMALTLCHLPCNEPAVERVFSLLHSICRSTRHNTTAKPLDPRLATILQRPRASEGMRDTWFYDFQAGTTPEVRTGATRVLLEYGIWIPDRITRTMF
jgi:hypothetical protein